MGSINYSKMTRDGDIADSKGISCRQYPYITTAKGNERVDSSEATSMTHFRGKWVKVAASGALYYDGKLVGRLTGGEKQFAAINTKLVIMPDKKYLDVSGEEPVLGDMGADLFATSPVFTENSLSLGNYYRMAGEVKILAFDECDPLLDFNAVELDYERSNFYIGIEKVPEKDQWRVAVMKHIFYGQVYFESFGDDINRAGFRSTNIDVMQITSPHEVYITDLTSGKSGWYTISYDLNEPNRYTLNKEYNLFSTSQQLDRRLEIWAIDQDATDILATGIRKLRIDGRELFLKVEELDCEAVYIYVSCSSFDGSKLTPGIHFVEKMDNGGWSGDFTNIMQGDSVMQLKFDSYCVKGKVVSGSVESNKFALYGLNEISETGSGLFDESLTLNSVVTLSEVRDNSANLNVFTPGDVVIVTEHPSGKNEFGFRIDTIDPDGGTCYAAWNIFAEKSFNGAIKIERRIPDLDFICVHDNRLYGCSNKDNTIYVSALGDPTNIYAYQGVSTDSYSVAVASEGEFTGCCPYDGGVLFWKENTLHKLLGSYPAEYALYTYNIEGVQKGSHRSLQNIGEVIYYKGARGVFVFDGSPRLISESFGEKRFKNAVAGNDGESYYISMAEDLGDEQVRDHFFSYNTRTGIWVREDEARVSQFVKNDQGLYMLKKKADGGENDNGGVYLYGASETGSDSEWYVQFTPIYETIEGKKSYSRIKLRVEVPRDSYMIISIRCDGGRWVECGKVVGKREGIVPVLVPVNRCDKFELKISGKGPCTIHSILREYYVGGDR